jgi:SNF family Na+-dependent transporter
VVYFTALFPYAVLLILLVRGLTLPGASNGIHYLFVPDLSKLLHVDVWVAAVSQVFYGLGLSTGSITVYGSFTNRRNGLLACDGSACG